MDNIIVSFNVIAPVFFLMVLGYFLVNYTSLADGKLTKQAKDLNMAAETGLDMLVAQAVYAQEFYQNRKLCSSDEEYRTLIDGIVEKIIPML